jgi:hypothetical protein
LGGTNANLYSQHLMDELGKYIAGNETIQNVKKKTKDIINQ